ncbi:MAG: hypothetical protein IPK03_12715 [Bacteroidetes bacterium]|nr:hypothetical protein [Bacteroidota bacterium]
MNRWIKILEANREAKFPMWDFGLSPRFIIGACQIPIGSPFKTELLSKEGTEQMFEEMKRHNSNGLIVSTINCDKVKGPIMELTSRKWSDDSIGITFNEIWERYGAEITEAKYNITSEERKILERLFNQ